MYRKLVLAIAIGVLAAPLVVRAQDDDSEWGWIDQANQVEEYDFEPGQTVSFETFQDGLSPYGQWVSVGAYGRVWQPAQVSVGWRPYYYGNWAWTDEGWLWVSSEPWGWATYHYGRWAYDSFYGWVWVPGYQWAPAWVSWRFGAEYVGWAPLAPGYSVYVTNYPLVHDRWCFVPTDHFVGYPVQGHAYVGPRAAPIFARTQPAPPRATVHGAVAPAWGGPARPYVEKQIGRPIAPVRVQPVASPSAAAAAPTRQGVVPVYRPEIARPARDAKVTRPGGPNAPANAAAPRAAPASPLPGAGFERPPATAAPRSSPLPGAGSERPPATAAPRSSPLPGAGHQSEHSQQQGHSGGSLQSQSPQRVAPSAPGLSPVQRLDPAHRATTTTTPAPVPRSQPAPVPRARTNDDDDAPARAPSAPPPSQGSGGSQRGGNPGQGGGHGAPARR